MPRHHRLALLTTALLALSGCQGTSSSPKPAGGTIALGSLQLKPCVLSAQSGSLSLEAQCGTFTVPEDRGNPASRKIALNVAWLPPTQPGDNGNDPVLFLAGGPGQSAVESFPGLSPVFRDINRRRGILLVDQRGTGKSNLLNCKADPDMENTPEAARAAVIDCRDTLAKRADLRFYTTTDAVADLDAIRQAMGAPTVNLVGVSYGTRVAQQYAMRHPQSTRTITLDSPVANTLPLGNIFARNLDDALALQFDVCRKDTACSKAMGDPRQELDALLTRLRAAPQSVTYNDATSGERKTDTMTAQDVAGLVRMYAYVPTASALLPLLIHEANQGRPERLMALAKMLSGKMSDAMATGMQFSVICTEDAGSFVAQQGDENTVLGTDMTTGMAAACKEWPAGKKPADFNQPLTTAVPALIISGEFDPVTPPKYGADIVKGLRNGRHLTLKGQGHGALVAGCMPKLFTRFLEDADAKALDTKCLDTLPTTPPFTGFYGWEP